MSGIERVYWIAYGVMWASIAFGMACLIVAAIFAFAWRRAKKQIELLNVEQ